MRQTLITFDEIMSCVRKAGFTNVKQVRSVFLEPSGALSVLGYDDTLDSEVLHNVIGSDRFLAAKTAKP
jgi:uncharacterized membrane protein YcaP (DUF421 family)